MATLFRWMNDAWEGNSMTVRAMLLGVRLLNPKPKPGASNPAKNGVTEVPRALIDKVAPVKSSAMTDLCPIMQRHAYSTLPELRKVLGQIEPASNVTVVLLLDDRLQGRLSSIIRRPSANPTARLILASLSSRLSGLDTIGDLAASSASLGWQEIVFERHVVLAMENARQTLRENESLIILVPSSLEAANFQGSPI